MRAVTNFFDEKFLHEIKQFSSLIVGYSGGLDSTVLLHALFKELEAIKRMKQNVPQFIAVHVNHHLSENSQNWQAHCESICSQFNVPLIVKDVFIKQKNNKEEAARIARYDAFLSLMDDKTALILGHHFNDQTETLLLQLFRGAGIQGMAAMSASKTFAKGRLIRPLLAYSREILESYARTHQLVWIEDESNTDTNFSRNFLRHQMIPLLKERWPGVLQNLYRTSQHCRDAQINLEDLARIDCPEVDWDSKTFPLDQLNPNLTPTRIINVLRLWLRCQTIKPPSVHLMDQLLKNVILAKQDAVPQLYLGKGTWIKRYRKKLHLVSCSEILPSQKSVNARASMSALALPLIWKSFPKSLRLGRNLGYLEAKVAVQGLILPIDCVIEVRFRRGGELFYWRGQTKQLKKLFQEWGVPQWLREKIPLLYINEELACVVGYAISDNFYHPHRLGNSDKNNEDAPIYQVINIQGD